MRTLAINKTKLWYVEPTGSADYVDGDGFQTGEKINTFSTPVEIYITLYPSNGAIIEQIFGKDSALDMVAVSCDIELTKDTLLFFSLPTSDFETTYSYRVHDIKRSLNVFQYGLRSKE